MFATERYTIAGHRWRRLDATEVVGSITLYCLNCRQSWKSAAKYAVLPAVHRPQSRIGMTDAEILSLIKLKVLTVDVDRAIVCKSGNPLTVIERTHIKGEQKGTYRFVSVCWNGRKKKIALHRLVWMAAHQELVPDGHDIDHVKSQDDDTISNLRLLSSTKNRQLGAAKANQGF